MSLFDDALVMLKRLEWSATNADGATPTDACPVCNAWSHDLDCELMALIKKMESTPMQCRPLGTGERVSRTLEKLNEPTPFR